MAYPGELTARMVLLKGFMEQQVQPAGIDLRVSEIHVYKTTGTLGVNDRLLPETSPIKPHDGVWALTPGAYKIVFMDAVSIPDDAVGLCFPRSSLLRMGASLHCTVWDPGYRGIGEALLIVHNPHGIRIERGARVAQLILIRVEPKPSTVYRGRYYGERLGVEIRETRKQG